MMAGKIFLESAGRFLNALYSKPGMEFERIYKELNFCISNKITDKCPRDEMINRLNQNTENIAV